MKASVRWLRELCPQLPDDAAALATRLTAAGLEVEATSAFGLGAEACVVAGVVSTRPHPSRTGLRLVTVDRGGSLEEVVCGAPNVPEPGGLVVLAPLGAHLPAKGVTIERRSIAGVMSEGMLCSEAELGLTEDGDGLFVLAPGTAGAGARLVEALPAARDTILEISLTPNRPDGLGHVGLAREAAALFEVPFVSPVASDPGQPGEHATGPFRIHIEDADRCPHYAAAVLVGTRVAPSPPEIRWRLSSLGVRPISNVVDVTNLVMLEFGHPMHAFDLDRIRGPGIVVRRARSGEVLGTLDGLERKLVEDDLVIADSEGPLALAGVMGGTRSAILASTQRILLESAYFDPQGIRRAARRHGLHTESSHRFERGVDWGDSLAVVARAAALLAQLTSAKPASSYPYVEAKPLARRRIALRYGRIASILGTEIERAAAQGILGRLGFASRASLPEHDVWEVPSFRPDVSREVDLIEEIGRVRGYDAIPTTLPAIRASRDNGPRQALARRVRNAAVAVGLNEAVTYAFVNPVDLERVGARPASVVLLNPLSDEQSAMRTSLLPGLLRAVARAERHGDRDARLFTVAPIFLAGAKAAQPGAAKARGGPAGDGARAAGAAGALPPIAGQPMGGPAGGGARAASGAGALPPIAGQPGSGAAGGPVAVPPVSGLSGAGVTGGAGGALPVSGLSGAGPVGGAATAPTAPSDAEAPLPEERLTFAAVIAGERTGWLAPSQAVDVWDAKGFAQAVLARLLRREPDVRLAKEGDRPAALHPRGAAWLEFDGQRIGAIGPLHPDVADAFGISGPVVVVELNLVALEAVGERPLRFAPLPRFPASTRDLAIVVGNGVPAGEVERVVREAAGDLAEGVVLFDRFVGGVVPAGHASLGLRVVYRAADRTLTDAEIDERHGQVVLAVEKMFGATLRS